MLICLQLREQKIPKLITIPFQASVLRWPSFCARFSTCMGIAFFFNFLLTFYLQTAQIRQLRDLMRYRFKPTNMLNGEKNRVLNCLTVSNLKLDNVFADVYSKYSRSIISFILEHPGETFDVAPFVDSRCKTPVEDIQMPVDGAVCPEQALKLCQCLKNIDELEAHKAEIESGNFHDCRALQGFAESSFHNSRLVCKSNDRYCHRLGDWLRFPTAKHLSSWAGCCPRNDTSAKHVKSTRISHAGNYLKTLFVQVANALIKSKKHPEF